MRKEGEMLDRKLLPGKFVWYELVSKDAKKAQAFYGNVLGWTVRPYPMGDFTYDMIYTGDTMIGGYAAPQHAAHWKRQGASDSPASHWMAYVSVEDVDATAKAATVNHGKVVEAPFDAPGVGRMARIADPQGAELSLIRSDTGDAADALAPNGGWLWNELHTSDPKAALAFYERVVGFSHRAMEMGPGGTYHVISKAGVDRGGVTSHLPGGVAPHWLPYVNVDDIDATVGRARNLGAKIPTPSEDIPGIGRFAVLEDPTGARFAVMNPAPME
jgi:predicted enzyme related to lactoylglutathione lyase